MELLGETKTAPCYGLEKDKDPYRSVPHKWHSLTKSEYKGKVAEEIEGCNECGGMRVVKKQVVLV